LDKKIAIVSVVLIALMLGFILPTQVSAFETGPGAPNTNYNEYGPLLSTIWIHGYANYAAEYNAIASKSSDLMDTTLVPSDYSNLVSLGGFAFSYVRQLGLDEIDWNNAFLPFSNALYKEAVSNILQDQPAFGGSGEKAHFVNAWLQAGGSPAYSPIPGCVVANSGYNWYDTSTASIYTGGYSAALSELLASGIPLASDLITSPGTYATWNFSTPFPNGGGSSPSYNPNVGPTATGWNQMGDGADNNHGAVGGLTILTRTSDQRVNIGPEVKTMLGDNFTWWYQNQASPADVSAFKSALSAAGLSTSLLPRIEVTVDQISMGQIYGPVFTYYCYEMYTGGYSYGFLPSSFLENYLTANSPQAFGWGPYHDPNAYSDNVYDGYEALMENSSTPLLGVTYAYDAQMELMGGTGTVGPALYPEWDAVGYSPTLATDYFTIPSAAYGGLLNWFTFLDAVVNSGSPGYATNAIYAGMRSVLPELPNPVSSSSYYSYEVLNEIWDTLTISNPYNLSQIIPYIATSWTPGTWSNPGTGKTDSMITATMREDVPWQDVPGPENRAKFTWNDGSELNGPMQNRYMTPLDVAFSYAYGAIGWGFTIAYDYSATYDFDHVVISSMYQSAWQGQIGHNSTVDGTPWANETYINNLFGISPTTPAWPVYQATTPGQKPYYTTAQYLENFVQFSPTLGPDQIQVYMSVLQPWLGPYYELGTVVLPMDIFSNLALGAWPDSGIHSGWVTPDMTIMDLQPYSYNSGTGADLMYGSGPFVLVDDAAAVSTSNFRLDAFVKGLTYGPGLTGTYGTDTVTISNGFFLSTPISPTLGSGTAYWKAGTSTLWLGQGFQNTGTASMTFSYTANIAFKPYVSGAWGATITPPAVTVTGITIPAGGTQMVWVPFPLKSLLPAGTTYIAITEWYSGTVTAGPAGYVGRGFCGGDYTIGGRHAWSNNDWAAYGPVSGVEKIWVANYAGAIAGTPATEPYFGGNSHRIGISDVNPIAFNWGKSVTWTGLINPTDQLHVASTSGGSRIGISDVNPVAFNWGKTATDTPPADPTGLP